MLPRKLSSHFIFDLGFGLWNLELILGSLMSNALAKLRFWSMESLSQ